MPLVIQTSVLCKAAHKLQGRIVFAGMNVSIENRKGSIRHWRDEHNNTSGQTKFEFPYGYIRGSIGSDGDHVDCYIGPNEKATHVFIINQMKAPDFKTFDEQKCFLGFDDADKAKKAYINHYDNPRFFGSMKALLIDKFRRKVLSTSQRKPLVKAVLSHETIQRFTNKAYKEDKQAETDQYGPCPECGAKKAKPWWGWSGVYLDVMCPNGHLRTIYFSKDMKLSEFAERVTGESLSPYLAVFVDRLEKAGPFIGPKGGKWADAAHMIPYREDKPKADLLRMSPDEFKRHVEKYGIDVEMHRGTSGGADPGTQWYAMSKKTAGRYAREGGTIKTQRVKMRRPYVASSAEIINATSVTIYRLRKQGYDGMVTQWSGGIPIKSNPNPQKDVWAVVFDNPEAKKSLPHLFIKSSGPFIGPRGGKWADAKHTIPWKEPERVPIVGSKVDIITNPKIFGAEQRFTYRVVKVADGKAKLSRHAGGEFGPVMPIASVKHFKNDLAGKVDLPKSGRADIDAVIEGKAELLGKGDDGIAFKVGDKVVKVSTTVPYQPENPGHRSPQGASDMLRKQHAITQEMIKAGVPRLQSSEFIQHGDKGFQIKEWVELPEKWSREQLDQIQDAVIAMHKKGYTLQDQVQAGLDKNGEPVLFDVGKARKIDPKTKDSLVYSDVRNDMDNLSILYRDSGEGFVRRDVDEAMQQWQKVANDIPKMVAKKDPKMLDFAAHLIKRAAEKRIKQARATLKGDALENELAVIDFDVTDVSFDVDKARNKLSKSQVDREPLIKSRSHKYTSRKRVGNKWVYQYGAIYRSPGFATVPKGFVDIGKHSGFKTFGTVSYEKPLSKEEKEHYSLVHIPGDVKEVIKHITDEYREYAEAHVEDYEDNSKMFEIGVGQILDKEMVHADRGEVTKLVIAELRKEVKKTSKVKKSNPALLIKAGPYIGPRGGKWANAKHTIPWTEQHAKRGGVRTGVVKVDAKKVRQAVDKLFDKAYGEIDKNGYRKFERSAQVSMGKNVVAELKHDPSESEAGHLGRARIDKNKTTVEVYAYEHVYDEWADRDKTKYRRVLMHELTHAGDPSLSRGKLGEATKRAYAALKAGDIDAANAALGLPVGMGVRPETIFNAYLNLRHEVTAKLQEIHRELITPDAAKFLRDKDKELGMLYGSDLIIWAEKYSNEFKLKFNEFTPANQKRIMRMVADTATGLRGGGIAEQKKSILTADTLSKAGPYIGPKGGKWADPQHTIPWKESGKAKLPEDPWRYFDKTSGAKLVSLSSVTPIHDGEFAVRRANQHMRDAYDGKAAKREPITLKAKGDGTYSVVDGNATFANAKANGWKQIPAIVEGKIEKSQRFTINADLFKAQRPPGSGWQTIPGGRKGGFRKRKGNRWDYWYPETKGRRGAAVKPEPELPTGPVAGTEAAIPAFADSRAKKDTVLFRVESGVYPKRQVRYFAEDADGVARIRKRTAMLIPDAEKVTLIKEFGGMMRKAAINTIKSFGIERTSETEKDLQSAAMEGFLNAIDSYPGGISFAQHAQFIANDYAKLHAAREFAGGVALPKRHARLIRGFIAARAEAGRIYETHKPTAEQVSQIWRLNKRDIHPGLITGKNEPLPMNRYGLRAGDVVTGKDEPGKAEWAEHLGAFIDGQAKAEGTEFFDRGIGLYGGQSAAGVGMSAHERIIVRHDLSGVLDDMKEYKWTEGYRTYKTNAAELIKRTLGLKGEPQSATEIAKDVKIEFLSSKRNEFRPLSERAVRRMIPTVFERAVTELRAKIHRPETKGLIERAIVRAIPEQKVSRGLEWRHRLQARAQALTREQIKSWREKQRSIYRRAEQVALRDGDKERAAGARVMHERLKNIGIKRARILAAEYQLRSEPRSAEWFKTAEAIVVERPVEGARHRGVVVSRTHPGTGEQQRVRVTNLSGMREQMYKADEGFDTIPGMGVIQLAAYFPMLSKLMFGSDDEFAMAPTLDREVVLELMGLI